VPWSADIAHGSTNAGDDQPERKEGRMILATLHSLDTTAIVVVILAVILAAAAYHYIPHPIGWIIAAVCILLGLLYLFG